MQAPLPVTPPPPPARAVPSAVWQRIDGLLSRVRPYRAALALLVDASIVAICWNVTYLFRLGFERWISARPGYDGWVLLGVIATYLAVAAVLRVPQAMWRFAGFADIKRLTLTCLIAGVLAGAVVITLGLAKVPRAVLALHPVVTLMGLALARIVYRMTYEHVRTQMAGRSGDARRAVILGAGEAARLLLAGLAQQGWEAIALFDDDSAKRGARVSGVAVVGDLDRLAREPQLATGATHLVVAMPSATPAQRRRAFDIAASIGLPVLTVPSADELRTGKSRVERLRDIEPEDLLGRESVVLDEAGIGATLRGKTVLVTGGGGSIGSELCRQVTRFEPARLVIVELSEFNLYTIEQELSEAFPSLELVRLIGDVKDLSQMRAIVGRWRPQVVFHAAAYKHVPLMEEHNALAALRNNTLGTYHAALAAAEVNAERFVLISTDKAVNPTNVMGATKRAAEMVVSALAAEPTHTYTKFIAVRFGNVLGSSGSVIPKFKEQIAKGGPVTVTHPDIIRYFMTIPEAARLVLQAAAIGETGQVLVLDMGEPVRIVDLAREMIRLAGRSETEIGIEFTGLRPGEKLYEELLAATDGTVPTTLASLRIAKLSDVETDIHRLLTWAAREDASPTEVQARLVAFVPQYAARSTFKSAPCTTPATGVPVERVVTLLPGAAGRS